MPSTAMYTDDDLNSAVLALYAVITVASLAIDRRALMVSALAIGAGLLLLSRFGTSVGCAY